MVLLYCNRSTNMNHCVKCNLLHFQETIDQFTSKNLFISRRAKSWIWILYREVFETLKIELEATLPIMKKSCAMTQFDKLLDQGKTKRTLIMIFESLFMRAREVRLLSICAISYNLSYVISI